MEILKCRVCGLEGEKSKFQTDRTKKAGVQKICIPCDNKKNKAFREQTKMSWTKEEKKKGKSKMPN